MQCCHPSERSDAGFTLLLRLGGQYAEKKFRRLRGFDYLAKVITGVKFKEGIEVTDVDQITA